MVTIFVCDLTGLESNVKLYWREQRAVCPSCHRISSRQPQCAELDSSLIHMVTVFVGDLTGLELRLNLSIEICQYLGALSGP